MINKFRHHLVKNAGSILRSPVQFLPFSVQKQSLLESLNLIFREALEDGDFEFLENKWLRVTVSDLNLSWHISYQEGKLIVAKADGEYDVHFSGNVNDLVLIAGRKEDPDTLFFQRRLKIEGDTELGLEVKNLMDSVDLDALPKFMRLSLKHLSGFVDKGLQPLEQLQPATQN